MVRKLRAHCLNGYPLRCAYHFRNTYDHDQKIYAMLLHHGTHPHTDNLHIKYTNAYTYIYTYTLHNQCIYIYIHMHTNIANKVDLPILTTNCSWILLWADFRVFCVCLRQAFLARHFLVFHEITMAYKTLRHYRMVPTQLCLLVYNPIEM